MWPCGMPPERRQHLSILRFSSSAESCNRQRYDLEQNPSGLHCREAVAPAPRRPVAVIPVDADAETQAMRLAHELRRAGFTVELGYRGNVSRRMKRANHLNASAAILLGADERSRNAVSLRDLDSGEQVEVPLPELSDRLAPYL